MHIKNWNILLWKYIENSYVGGGKPLYLAIDSYHLQKLFNEEYGYNESIRNCENSFLSACNAYVKIKNAKAEISTKVFQIWGYQRSLSLCYAVQQIIAVERMLSDENFTAKSYFPRYREVIGLNDGGNQIPISYDQFNLIWETLRSEILNLPGASHDTITFHHGSGINLNRALPISQALLSQESLHIIIEQFGQIDFYDDHSLIVRLRNKSYAFPKEVQNKIRNDYIKKALIKQIRSFAERSKSTRKILTKKATQKHSVTANQFEIYLDNEGWDDTYVLAMRDLAMSGDMEKHLDTFIDENRYLFFSEGIAGEFIGTELPLKISDDESIYVVARNNDKETLIDLLETTHSEYGKASYQIPPSRIPDGYIIIIYSPSIPKDNSLIIGKTGTPLFNEAPNMEISFQGGVCVNKHKREFITGYPPKKIFFENEVIDENEILLINQIPRTVKEFLGNLKKCDNDNVFSIEYRNAQTLLRLVIKRQIDKPLIGFEIINDKLSHYTTSLSSDDAKAYSHWYYINYEIKPSLKSPKKFQINKKHYYCDVKYWIPINKKQIEWILEGLMDLVEPNVRTIIKNEQKIPPFLYKMLLR